MKNKLTYWILGGLILGIIVGALVNYVFEGDKESIGVFVEYTSLGNHIFLRLIKLIIAPLVLSTLVVGVAGIGDAKTIGRMGAKTIGWFVFASLMSLTLGLILVNILEPGLAFTGQIQADANIGLKGEEFTLLHFIDQLFPENIIVALSSHKTVLQIVIFSVFFGWNRRKRRTNDKINGFSGACHAKTYQYYYVAGTFGGFQFYFGGYCQRRTRCFTKIQYADFNVLWRTSLTVGSSPRIWICLH